MFSFFPRRAAPYFFRFFRGVAATILKGLLPLPEVQKRSGGGLSGQGGGCRLGVNLYPGLKGLLPGIGIESEQGVGVSAF